ncbi:MAG TPA: acyltransferase family protein [Polyangiaceae bacterium]
MPSTSMTHTSIRHLPALDGLRGAAVAGVLLFHVNWLKGGYLGVDLFFVLSGFLITTLLLVEWQTHQSVTLSQFWIRRARRLMPALLMLLPAVSLYALFCAESTELGRIRSDGLATLLYVANWRAIFGGSDYWALFSAPSPLEHTWSLAIEEQFYVLWPVMVVVALKVSKGSNRAVFALSAALALGSMAAMALLYSPERTSRVYMGTDTRGASILFGAAFASLALGRIELVERWKRIALELLGCLACLWLMYAWSCIDGQSRFLYRGGFWLSELATLVLLACACQGQASWVGRMFMFQPLRSLGLISYGLYLWHWPIFVALTEPRVHLSGLWLASLRLGVSLLVALVSYHFVERPIRRNGLHGFSPALIVPACMFLSVGAILFSTRGATAVPRSAFSATRSALPSAETIHDGDLRVLVLGDSVALSLGESMQCVAAHHQAMIATRAVGNCSLFEHVVPALSLEQRPHAGGNCSIDWEVDVRSIKPDAVLVVLGGAYFAKAKVDGRWQSACDPGWTHVLRKELRARLETLARYSTHVLVARVPYPAESWRGGDWRTKVNCFNSIVETETAKVEGAKVLDLYDYLCHGGNCQVESQGALIRPDGVHFQGPGAEESAAWVIENIRATTTT